LFVCKIVYLFRPTTKLVGTFLLLFPEGIAQKESMEMRNMISADVRFLEEKPLGKSEKVVWSRYVTALQKWLNK
jgi:hypothetical protein